MLAFNDKGMTYDDNGNLASITTSCGTTIFNWDVRNQLVGFTGFKPDCSAPGGSAAHDTVC